jgi:Ca2+-binding RTX toxin-like protein
MGMDTITGSTFDDVISGTAGADIITDTWGDDIINGGDGDDVIIDEGGSNQIQGGNGNDTIRLTDIYTATSTAFGGPFYDSSNPIARNNVISAGAGTDNVFISVDTPGTLNIDLGTGDDQVVFNRGVSYSGHTSLTLGAGRDRIVLDFNFGDTLRVGLGFKPIVITDFAVGASGDVIDIAEALRGLLGYTIVAANPFVSGHLRLVQDGADTIIRVDIDGTGGGVGNAYARDLFRLNNVNASTLTAYNLAGYVPTKSGADPVAGTVTGTAGTDLLGAGAGGDTLNGLGGNDVLTGSIGNDTLDGGAGNDQINGGAGNDILRGGDGDDILNDIQGNDVIEGGGGNDIITIFRSQLQPGFAPLAETVTIDAGDGNDLVSYEIARDTYASTNRRSASLNANLGAGDDVYNLEHPLAGGLSLTLGTGQDRIVYGRYYLSGEYFGPNANVGTIAVPVITDFAVGNSGDILELDSTVFRAQGWNGVSNPFASGHLRLTQQGADTLVIFDYDGSGGGSGAFYEFTLARLSNVNAASLTAFNFGGYNPSGASSALTISSGTAGDDVLILTSYGNDIINGGAGNDRIEARRAGSDTISGGDGNDVIIVAQDWTPTNDVITVSGGLGDDVLDFIANQSSGNALTLLADLGDGNDRLILRSSPNSGNTTVTTAGATITLGGGSDVVTLDGNLASERLGPITITDFQTGAGGDQLDWRLYIQAELFEGAPGYNPFIDGRARLVQSGAHTLLQITPNIIGYSTTGFETLITFQNTTVSAFTAFNLGFDPNLDTQTGTPSGEALTGTALVDVLSGLGGNDQLFGLDGDDRLYGNDGDDTINGDGGNDTLYGGAGVDTLNGGAGNDILDGGDSFDQINGGDGDDFIRSRSGGDNVTGGAGNDRIIFDRASSGNIDAGDGNDFVAINAEGSGFTVNLGAGDDRIRTNGSFGTLTLGSGQDSIEFFAGSGSGGNMLTITDFETGANGDRYDLQTFSINRLPVLGANPFEFGYTRLQQNGANVDLIYIPGGSGQFAEETLARFNNTTVAQFTAANFNGIDPHVAPNLVEMVRSSRTIDAGVVNSRTNIAPVSLATNSQSVHFVFDVPSGNAQFINHGAVETNGTLPGYGELAGFAVSRFSGSSPTALFHNAVDGTFRVNWQWSDPSGDISGGRAIGYDAPQQSTIFRNDGLFDVRAASGTAIGVRSGFDATNSNPIINTGTFNVLSAYDATGFRLGFSSDFDNSGQITVHGDNLAIGLTYNQYNGNVSIHNSGSITVTTSPTSPFYSYGIYLPQGLELAPGQYYHIYNSGTITAEIAIYHQDNITPRAVADMLHNSGTINGVVLMGSGNDSIINTNLLHGDIYLENGADIVNNSGRIDGFVDLGAGNDVYDASGGGLQLSGAVFGGDGNDQIAGGASNEIFFGDGGDDALKGSGGNDLLFGGAGFDTAYYNAASNAIGTAAFRTVTGVAVVRTATEGNDVLNGIEQARFSNTTLALSAFTNFGVSDVGGDGDSDIIYFSQSSGAVLHADFQNGVFTQTGVVGETFSGNWDVQVTGDFNRDGVADMILKDASNGRFYIWTLGGNGSQVGGRDLGVIGTSWNTVASGDYNSDGVADLLWRDASNGHLYVWTLDQATGLSGSASLGVLGTNWSAAGSGDFDGDGTSDVLLRDSNNGQLYVYYLQDGAYQRGGSVNVFGTNWSVAGVGDFNNDGRADIMLKNTNTGQFYNLAMNGTNAGDYNGSSLDTIGTAWNIAQTGDYNGDGTDDILWRNTSTDQVYLWAMQNGQQAATGSGHVGIFGADAVIV